MTQLHAFLLALGLLLLAAAAFASGYDLLGIASMGACILVTLTGGRR